MLTLKNLPGGCLVRAEPDYFVYYFIKLRCKKQM